MRATLASLIDDFHRHRDGIAIVAHRGNRRYGTTYGELAELAGRFSAELEARGVLPGERVVLWGENSAEWVGCFFGCVLRGVIAVPLDAAGAAEFTARVVRDVAPKMIVGDPALLRVLQPELPQGVAQMSFGTLTNVLPRVCSLSVSNSVTNNIPFQIVFTSGTTSEPKGIVHTHRNVLVTLEPIEREMQHYLRYERWVHPLRFLHSVPLSHVFGQFMGLWIPALLGAEVHFTDSFETSGMLDTIRRERISVLIAVPRVLQLVRAHLLARFAGLAAELDAAERMPIARRWWTFRRVHRMLGWKFWAVICGGATLPAEVERFWGRLGLALIQGYGMTETTALVTLNHPFRIKQGSIGSTLPGREVKITEEGEILVRGEMLSSATWRRGRMEEREGEWLATGDLAEQSASGELRFVGRKGDVIVTAAGMNLHPGDIEQALSRQPGVRGCAVVGCELAAGTEPVAVVLFTGSDAELASAVDGANRTLAEFQQIRRVLRWPEVVFPYTPNGKLLRRQIAAWACGERGALSHTRKEYAGQGDVLLALIAEVTGEAVGVGSGSAAELRLSDDLHLDSLGRVQLQSLIEQRLGIEMDDDVAAGARTMGELRTVVERGMGPGLQRAGSSERPGCEGHEQAGSDDAQSYPTWPWTWPIRVVRVAFLEVVVRPLVALLAAPRIVRRDVTYPDGPLLLIANHVTAYDGALVLHALPGPLRRRVAAAMSGDMLLDLRHGRNQGSWWLNWIAPAGYALVTALFNVFPLPRARGFRRSFAHAGRAMDNGYSVLIFPEGTRTRDGQMHAFRPGIGLLARQSGVPVLPVALAGLGELKMGRVRWFRSGRLTVLVGTPITISETEQPAESARRLEAAVRELLSEHM